MTRCRLPVCEALSRAAFALALTAAAGCAGWPGAWPGASAGAAAPRSLLVLVEGGRAALAEAGAPALTAEALVERVEWLAAEKKAPAIRRLVRRHPDAALAALRTLSQAQVSRPYCLFLARAFDVEFANPAAPPSAGFESWVAERRAHPARYLEFDAERDRVLLLLGKGDPAQALKAGLLEGSTFGAGLGPDAADGRSGPVSVSLGPSLHPLASGEALRLRGAALLLDGKPAEASTAFSEALKRAAGLRPLEAEIGLLWGEAQRRAGREDEACRLWGEAARAAAFARDPNLWERMASWRPAGAAWPAAAVEFLADSVDIQRPAPAGVESAGGPGKANGAPGAGFDQGLLWAALGAWRLDRGENQAALLAFTRGQAEAGSDGLKAEARLGQARSLLALGQRGPALAALVQLSDGGPAPASLKAGAGLGVIFLQEGRLDEGVKCLKAAVGKAGGTTALWRPRAEADLGLALLMQGREVEGLGNLHRAQAGFEKGGRLEDLAQSLSNEADYLAETNRPDEAKALRARAADLAREAGVDPPWENHKFQAPKHK